MSEKNGTGSGEEGGTGEGAGAEGAGAATPDAKPQRRKLSPKDRLLELIASQERIVERARKHYDTCTKALAEANQKHAHEAEQLAQLKRGAGVTDAELVEAVSEGSWTDRTGHSGRFA
jgi:hypothetical protein